MKKLFKSCKQSLPLSVSVFALLLSGLFASCDGPGKATESEDVSRMSLPTASAPTSLPYSGNLVEVRTEHMNFIMPDEIPSGWTTFRYYNESKLTHFMLIDKLPVFEGKQITKESFKEVPGIFHDAMDLINEGKAVEGFAEFSRLPAWFPQIVFKGGVGLVSPGETAQTTVFVEPGTYIVECYVKTAGKFHPMSKQLIVKKETSDGTSPTPTLNVEVSREGGIELKDEPTAGLHTIAVHFENQGPHENFMGHDVHLASLKENTDVAALNDWMNWAEPQGLNTPAPASFLGGAQEMPAGNTAYFTVFLKPGRYAFVSEVPEPSGKGMLKTFTVPNLKEAVKGVASQ